MLPDRTLLLALPEQDAMARQASRDAGNSDRFGARDAAYHAAVHQTFRQLAEADPVRWRIVDATGTAETVTARLLDAVGDLT